MDVLRESRYIISSFIIIIVCWLGWLCGLVFGQVGEAFTSAVNFPDVGLTCLANSAAFFKFILHGKDLHEVKAKLSEATLRQEKNRNINGLEVRTTCGENLQECSVVMLSFHYPATSVARKFMNSISDVHSIILPCHPLKCGAFTEDFTEDFVKCSCAEDQDGGCGCIIFKTVKDITMMLARRLPGTLKELCGYYCLIPSLRCLNEGCHGCNEGLLRVENDILERDGPKAEFPAAVCEILGSIHKVNACICIPLLQANDDKWTNELIRIFKPQKREFRGVVFREGGTNASSALENYKNNNEACDAEETYSLASLAIVPHLAHPLMVFVLTFLLKVDGFSSVMLASRSISSFLLSGHQIPPFEYLTRVRVKSNTNNTNVCQVLFSRPAFQIYIHQSLFICSAGICCIGWMVLVAKEGGAHKWYHIQSTAPSEGRIIVIMVAISIALALDLFDLKLYLQIRGWPCFRGSCPWKIGIFHKCRGMTIDRVNIFLFCATIGLQLLYMVGCIAIGRVVGIKAFGRWIYSALQCLVLLKWGTSVLMISNCQYALNHASPEDEKAMWWYGSCGHYIGASAFLLNATLAGVRAEWKFS